MPVRLCAFFSLIEMYKSREINLCRRFIDLFENWRARDEANPVQRYQLQFLNQSQAGKVKLALSLTLRIPKTENIDRKLGNTLSEIRKMRGKGPWKVFMLHWPICCSSLWSLSSFILSALWLICSYSQKKNVLERMAFIENNFCLERSKNTIPCFHTDRGGPWKTYLLEQSFESQRSPILTSS